MMSELPNSPRSENAIKKHEKILSEQMSQKGLKLGEPIFMRIIKEENVLEVWVQNGSTFKHFKNYKICTFSGGIGHKEKLGDGKSPEGFYYVSPSGMNPWSKFHLSFNIGYPNKYDKAHNYTGNYIMVHGSCVSIGCYAMTDKRIEEIYTIAQKAFEGGQAFFRIHIFPFRMTNDELQKHSDSKWYSFWQNLQEGFEYFEKTNTPPNVGVHDKKYTFN